MTERALTDNTTEIKITKQPPYLGDKDEAKRVIKFSNFSFFMTGESYA